MPESSAVEKTGRGVANRAFRSKLDKATNRVEEKIEVREKRRKHLEYRVKNSSAKEAIKAQAQLKKEFGLIVYTKKEIKAFSAERAIALSNVCHFAERSLKYFEKLYRDASGNIPTEQQDLIHEIRESIKTLRGVGL